MSTLVRLFPLSFFFFFFFVSFCLPSYLFLKVFQEYIGRERERAIQKKDTEQKGERESIQYKKKKETQLRKNEEWNTREKRERTSILRYSDRNRFSWKGLSFACSACNLISVSERCAIRCYFEQGH